MNFIDIDSPMIKTTGSTLVSNQVSALHSTTKLNQWIVADSFGYLLNARPGDPAEAAKLCEAYATTHSAAVTTLLANKDVALAVIQRLQLQGGSDIDPVVDALLKAGHADTIEQALGQKIPASLKKKLTELAQASDDYWSAKALDYAQLKKSIKFKKHWPHFSKSEKKSQVNLNGKLPDARLVCRDLSIAFKMADSPNAFFKMVDSSKVALNFDKLEEVASFDQLTEGERSIHFSPAKFGEICVRLLAMNPAGGKYYINYCAKPSDKNGHQMCVLLEPVKKGLLLGHGAKISFFDPNYTRDTKHVTDTHGNLMKLSLDAFCETEFEDRGLSTLSINLNDKEVADGWKGKFVKNDTSSQMGSLSQALASDNVGEVKAALDHLKLGLIWTDDRKGEKLRELSNCLAQAIHWRYNEGIYALAESNVLEKLTSTEVGVIFSAPIYEGAIIEAVRKNHWKTLLAIFYLLDRLNASSLTVRSVIEARSADFGTCLSVAIKKFPASNNVLKIIFDQIQGNIGKLGAHHVEQILEGGVESLLEVQDERENAKVLLMYYVNLAEQIKSQKIVEQILDSDVDGIDSIKEQINTMLQEWKKSAKEDLNKKNVPSSDGWPSDSLSDPS